MEIIWTIAFDVYETKESVKEGKPTTDGCYLDPQELPEELRTQIGAVLASRVKANRF